MKQKASRIESLVEKRISLFQASRRAEDEARREERAVEPVGRFITLSREAGTLAPRVAALLAARLGWKVFDSEIVEYMSRRSSVHQALVQTLDESARNFVTDAVSTLLEAVEHREFGVSGYRESLIATLVAIAHHGDAIILGRGGNIVLGGRPGGLRVRLMAPWAHRLAQFAREEGLEEAEAARRLRQMDRERRAFIRQMFGREIEDPLGYDLVINTAGMSLEAVAELVWRAADLRFSAAS